MRNYVKEMEFIESRKTSFESFFSAAFRRIVLHRIFRADIHV